MLRKGSQSNLRRCLMPLYAGSDLHANNNHAEIIAGLAFERIRRALPYRFSLTGYSLFPIFNPSQSDFLSSNYSIRSVPSIIYQFFCPGRDPQRGPDGRPCEHVCPGPPLRHPTVDRRWDERVAGAGSHRRDVRPARGALGQPLARYRTGGGAHEQYGCPSILSLDLTRPAEGRSS